MQNDSGEEPPKGRPPLRKQALGIGLGLLLASALVTAGGAAYLVSRFGAQAIAQTASLWVRHHFHSGKCGNDQSTVAALPAVGTPPTLTARVSLTGLEAPVGLAALPDQKLLIAEKRGQLKVHKEGEASAKLVGDLSSFVDSSLQNGLLGIVLHPRFGVGGEDRAFVMFTRSGDGAVVVASLELKSPGSSIDLTSVRMVLVVPRANNDHPGGGMTFLPSGSLLIGIGDGLIPAEAQNESSFLGKIVEINVDDPSVGPQIFARGFRNPWRIASDPGGDEVWISDVGSDCIEEIDRVALTAPKEQRNFGWPTYEGESLNSMDLVMRGMNPEPPNGFARPITTYAHTPDGACAAIGGAVIGDWYVFGDYCDGVLRGVPIDASVGTAPAPLLDLNSLGSRVGITGVIRDSTGRLWALDEWGGAIISIESTP